AAQPTPSGGKPGRVRPRSLENTSQQATPSRSPTPRSRAIRREPNARAVRANATVPAMGKPRGRMRKTGSTPAATVIQNAAREAGRVTSASSASWGSKRSPRATATRSSRPRTTRPAPITAGKNPGPTTGQVDGEVPDRGEGRGAVQPDEAGGDDDASEPPRTNPRPSPPVGRTARRELRLTAAHRFGSRPGHGCQRIRTAVTSVT